MHKTVVKVMDKTKSTKKINKYDNQEIHLHFLEWGKYSEISFVKIQAAFEHGKLRLILL